MNLIACSFVISVYLQFVVSVYLGMCLLPLVFCRFSFTHVWNSLATTYASLMKAPGCRQYTLIIADWSTSQSQKLWLSLVLYLGLFSLSHASLLLLSNVFSGLADHNTCTLAAPPPKALLHLHNRQIFTAIMTSLSACCK